MEKIKLELTEREITIAICSLSDYHFQFINDTSNQDLLLDIINLISKLEGNIKNI